MASTFSKLRDNMTDDLEDQIASLRHEVSSLKKALSKRGAAALADSREHASEFRDHATDLYDDFMSRMHDAVPNLQRHGREMRKVARDNPVATAVVGLAVLGLVAGLLMRR
ncbi:hypothetical protein C7441_107181 [Pseudaminobacter salicylatoxidans]|uniref:ElaB/YqjD/DUF883 family membrane-anchored ribosome-binding protein n=1 Tax=Pseudaminobacter salicylatoxidans TaxID=93369 RepID=A0A316C2Q6_PSESE|nr:hypothetical protein [Pseudaminobacter salicylatoxidans]PWJ84019.1 hypothetical protein C7441_107181 [Pseudaminobacter salicylatoxidans]